MESFLVMEIAHTLEPKSFKINLASGALKENKMQEKVTCKAKNHLILHDVKHCPVIASTLGYDYLQRTPYIGFSTMFNKILSALSKNHPCNAAKEIRKLSKSQVPLAYEEKVACFRYFSNARQLFLLNINCCRCRG